MTETLFMVLQWMATGFSIAILVQLLLLWQRVRDKLNLIGDVAIILITITHIWSAVLPALIDIRHMTFDGPVGLMVISFSVINGLGLCLGLYCLNHRPFFEGE